MVTSFWYDEDDAAFLARLERLFRLGFFQQTVLGPRSVRLPPTRTNLRRVLQPDPDQSSDVRFVVSRGKKSLRGTPNLTRNSFWVSPGFTSFLELTFSLSEGYKGSPFHDAYEVRDVLLGLVHVGPSPMGFVECEDESDEQKAANFELFRSIDNMAVPVTIEWVTVLHADVVARMGADLMAAAATTGVLAGRQGDFWWLILSEEPFSFTKQECARRYQAMREAIGLEAIHEKFRRR